MKTDKNCRLACNKEILQVCQHISKEAGFRISAITEQAIREWCEKRGYDIKTILEKEQE
jgi:hypothetical protein